VITSDGTVSGEITREYRLIPRAAIPETGTAGQLEGCAHTRQRTSGGGSLGTGPSPSELASQSGDARRAGGDERLLRMDNLPSAFSSTKELFASPYSSFGQGEAEPLSFGQ
jgi:hypothetical protein